MSCISSVTYSVLLNGRSHGYIKPSRGLRQGDPLSTFLFILGAEALISVLNIADQTNKLTGICFSPPGPSINHLLFADDSLMVCKTSMNECEELMRCLQLYCNASGQLINYQKSSIIFGSKVMESVKDEVKHKLGITAEGGDGTYLGLPECFSGSKQRLLSFIHKKLNNRLNGWFSKALSQGGKEILLKSIALALPVYAMSCFKLSKGLCDKLRSAMIEYWWSSGNNRRKISWVAWQKLCLSKIDGGLGFHDIALFNQSLLGKQAWRLLDQPDSLVAQVMKSRYYDEDHFLVARLGPRPSYAWRSICLGRELLLQGLLRTIGNGRTTLDFNAKWILDEQTRVPVRTGFEINPLLRVVDLINRETGTWNEHLVRQVFVPADAARILDMRISMSTPDGFILSLTKHGRYTSQSGYKLLVSSHNEYQVTTAPIEKALWTKIWKLKTSPKTRHFIWKVMHEALAAASRLQTRGINIPSMCRMCNSGVENTAHALFSCPEALQVWQRSGLTLPPNGFSSNSVFVNIHFLVENVRKDRSIGVEFFWILWHIWKARNALIFEHVRWSLDNVLQKAVDSALEWKAINQSDIDTNRVPSQQQRWSPPSHTYLKCNIACYRSRLMEHMGLAWVLRNEQGVVLLHARDSTPFTTDCLLAELRCFLWSISSMVDLHHSKVIFESCSRQAFEAINSPSSFPAYRIILQEIKAMLSRMPEWNIFSIPPCSNIIAISIAKSATDNRPHSYIQASAPSWLVSEIANEAPSA